MYNIKSIVFQFNDTNIYCVGFDQYIDLLIRFYDIQKNHLNSKFFIDRIIMYKIYTRIKPKTLCSIIRYRNYISILKSKNLLLDLKYFDEAMFISDPSKIISALNANNFYGEYFLVSKYWKDRFPHLPEKFIIHK